MVTSTQTITSQVAPFRFLLVLSWPAAFVNIGRINDLTPSANSPLLTNRQILLFGWLTSLTGFYFVFINVLQSYLDSTNRFFTYYRSVHLLSGVSPIVPFLAITIGMYLWFWFSL